MSAVMKNSEHTQRLLVIFAVSILLPLAQGQSYHFVIGHHQRNVEPLYRDSITKTYVADTKNLTDTNAAGDLEKLNSTIIVTTIREQTNELSQTAMDIITIVWYVATFLALAAFFLLMACSDKRCNGNQHNVNMNTNDQPIPPPTPSPSYSAFAPPSYETVMKKQHANKNSVFLLPFATSNQEQNAAKDSVATTDTANNNVSNTVEQPSTPSISFSTVNEVPQKTAS